MPEKVTDLNRIIWQQRQAKEKPDIKLSADGFLMDTMPFYAVLKEKLTDDKPLQYLCEGKYISFKPVGRLSTKGLLRADKRSVAYKDGLGAGVSLEVEVSQSHWKKLIKIDSLSAVDTSQKFIEFKFLVETDFDIPERENKKPRIKLGENSFIEVSQAWDSSPVIEDAETSKNRIPVKSFFKKIDGNLYFIKQIPTEWLKTAQFPVWTDVDIVYGSASEFESGQTQLCQCCEIDTNKFVVVYKDVGDGEAGKARVATVSGTTITWGAINEFCPDVGVGSQLGVCKLDTDKFVVVYADDAQLDDGYARVGTVSTRTISWGTAKEFETGDTEYPSCCQLGTDKFAIVYNDETAGDLGTVCIATVSGTTITSGTPIAFEGKTLYNRCCKLDTDKLVAVYRDNIDGKCKSCAFTVVGTVPTPGTIKEIDANSSSYMDCAQLDTDKFVIAWRDSTDTAGAIEICTVSGTTITEGAEVEFNPDNAWNIGVDKIDATHFVVIYQDAGNADKGTSRYCSFSGDTITLDGEEIFHDALTQLIDVCLISADKIAVVYRDNADVNKIGEAIIGDTPVVSVDYTKTFSDTITIGDSPVLVATFERTFSDTITLADAISKEPGLIKSDSIGITDSIIKAITLIKADTITISDSIVDVSEFYLAIADTIAIADAISKEPGLFESDTIAIADSFVKILGVALSLALADTVAIADAISKKSGLIKSDILDVADSIVLAAEFKRALSDTITIADAIVKAMSIPQVDTVTIADSISKDIGLVKSDTITISDVFSKVMAYILNLSDTILMNDSISKAISMVKSDIISIADSIVVHRILKIVLSDIITITDKVKLSYPVRRAVTIGRMTIKRIASARLPYKKTHEEDV